MARKKAVESTYGYKEFRSDFRNGSLRRLYVFCGEESYLLRDALGMLRGSVAEEGGDFNLRRFEGKSFSIADLAGAVNTFPMSSERTLVEVWDYDFAKADEETREQLLRIFSELPEYTCVVFVYDTIAFNLDARMKINSDIKKLMTVVEFRVQDPGDLIGWIRSHFSAEGKRIGPEAAERLAMMTGGRMTLLLSEIEKLSSYCSGGEVTEKDIDAVVTPVLDTAVYELMDKLISRNYGAAAQKLGELISMNEAPQKIIYDVTATLRQMLGARICLDDGISRDGFVELFDLKKRAFLAKKYFEAARRLDVGHLAHALELSTETAYMLNSAPFDGADLLSELLIKLAVCIEEA